MGVIVRILGAGGLLAATFLSAAFLAGSTRAYNNQDNAFCTWPYSGGGANLLYVFWKNDPVDPPPDDYATALANGHSHWTLSATPLIWYYWAGVVQNTEAAPYLGWADGTLGETTRFKPTGSSTCSYYTLRLNRTNLDNGGWPLLQTTTDHELGHVATAGHSTAPAAATLMRAEYSSSQPTTPQFDDLCAINTRYWSTRWPATGC